MDIITLVQANFNDFLQSYFFAALKIFFGIYSIVLILNIVLILSFRNLGNILKQGTYGTEFVPSLSQSVMKKRWTKIEERLRGNNVSEYKVAILEADSLVDGVLTDIGYVGADMAQKIEQLRVLQPEDAAVLDEAHQIRNRIVFEQDFQIDHTQSEKTLNIYKSYLKKFDYFQ